MATAGGLAASTELREACQGLNTTFKSPREMGLCLKIAANPVSNRMHAVLGLLPGGCFSGAGGRSEKG
jgi:hypothetical protein